MRDKLSPGAVVAIVLVGIFVVVALLDGFTILSTDEQATLTDVFDPAAYVEDNWDAVQLAIKEGAVPLADLLNAIQPEADGTVATADLAPIVAAMGSVLSGEAQVYRVTGTGTVTDVDVESSKGSVGIAVDGYDGPIKVRAWIGTRIPSDNSAVRDAAGFIGFGDFREQTEFGKVAKEINSKVVENLEGLDTANLAGKGVEFTGALGLRTANMPTLDVSELDIVPIEVIER
jgi:predicted lipoprotein